MNILYMVNFYGIIIYTISYFVALGPSNLQAANTTPSAVR